MKTEHIVSSIIYLFLMAGIVALWVFDNKLLSLILFLVAIVLFVIDLTYFMLKYKDDDGWGD